MERELGFYVLGELMVRVDERDVPLPGPSVRALLGVLLLTGGQVVGDERLLELAWGSEKGSRRALQCAVSRLRTWLRDRVGSGCRLEHGGSGYRLEVPRSDVDLDRFRGRLRDSTRTGDPEQRLTLLLGALGEWRGPVLGGRPEWLSADPSVRAVEQARVDGACALADVALRLGRPAEAVPVLTEVAAAAPYDEPIQARLVQLLSAGGRPAEAVRHVVRVRQRLADDLGVVPSDEVSSAQAAAMRTADRSWRPPAQLPPDVPDFTGRDRETEAVCDWLLGGRAAGRHRSVVVSQIAGMAGVGKSALAVRAAHRLAALFVDGQLYVDLQGTGRKGADPATVLGWFLRALGVGRAAVPDSLEERTALYRTRTAGRKLLVVLDNATGERQVRSLMPSAAGCAVLVTSRTRLAGLAGAQLVDLDGLTGDEATALFGRVAGRAGLAAEPAAREVVRLCGYLPLAVRIAGARLAARPRLTLDRLTAGLRDEGRRLDELTLDGLSVRPYLDRGYWPLTPTRRRAFRRLGLLAAPDFPVWAAAALLDSTVDSARADLESLVDARLVDLLGDDPAGQLRYGMPDLIRLYARERAEAEDGPADRVAAVHRAITAWLDHAEATASRAWFAAEAGALRATAEQSRVYGFTDLTAGLARWFDSESLMRAD